MKLSNIFNYKNLVIIFGLFINLNIYVQEMILINNYSNNELTATVDSSKSHISYGLLLLQMVLNIVLLYVTSYIKNNNIEIFIWILFSLCIILSDYLNSIKSCSNNNNNNYHYHINSENNLTNDNQLNHKPQYNIDNDLWYQPNLANSNGLATLSSNLYANVDN